MFKDNNSPTLHEMLGEGVLTLPPDKLLGVFNPTGGLDSYLHWDELEGESINSEFSPKELWAIANPAYFPVNINCASKEEILRIPGVGPVSAKRIIKYRKIHRLRSLSDVGVKGKLLAKATPYAAAD